MSALGDPRTLAAAQKRHQQDDAIRDLAREVARQWPSITSEQLRVALIGALRRLDLTLTREP